MQVHVQVKKQPFLNVSIFLSCFFLSEGLLTSYLATDVFLRRDDLVHVGSQSGVQLDPLDLAGLHQGVELAAGLREHLPVHCV